MQQAKADHLAKQEAVVNDTYVGNQSQMQAAKKIGKLEATRQLNTLWLPIAPRLSLGGLKLSAAQAFELGVAGCKTEPSCIVIDPGDVNEGLAGVWKHVFSEKFIDEEAALKILGTYANS